MDNMYIEITHTHAQDVARGSGFKLLRLKNLFFSSKARKPIELLRAEQNIEPDISSRLRASIRDQISH